MKIIIDIAAAHADFMLAVLKNMRLVKKAEPMTKPGSKTKPLLRAKPAVKSSKKETPYRASAKQEILDGIKEGYLQAQLAKQGKIKLKSARELLSEL